MNKRVSLNLAMLLFIGVLIAVVYFEPGTDKPELRKSLLSLEEEQIDKIQLVSGTAQSITIERSANAWMITAPIRVAANDFRIESLLKLAKATSHSRFPAAEQSLANFGLDKPSVKVTFNQQTIFFGANEPLNRRRYVLAGEQVHLIEDYYFYQAQLMLTAFVDAALFSSERKLTQIQLPDFLLQQKNGHWQLHYTVSSDANRNKSMDEINSLLSEWRHARAQQVSQYQPAENVGKIKLLFANEEALEFEILSREPELILGRSDLGLRFHFSADQGKRLLDLSAHAWAQDSGAEVSTEATQNGS